MVGQLVRYASCRVVSCWRYSSSSSSSSRIRMATATGPSSNQLVVKRAGIIIIGDEILKGETQVHPPGHCVHGTLLFAFSLS